MGRGRERDEPRGSAAARPDADEDDRVSWPSVALFEDSLAVAELCCDPVPEFERWHVVRVDRADRRVHERLLAAERIEATRLDGDADAQELLIVANRGPGGGRLLRWDEHGDPNELADEIIVAAW